MWKPGTAKPRPSAGNNNKNNRKRGPKKNRAPIAMEDNGESNDNKPPASAPKKLSGATMNMRFMQRKAQQTQNEKKYETKRESSPQRPAQQDREDPMQVDDHDDTVAQSGLVASYAAQQQQHDDGESDSLIDPTPATTSDMYGMRVDVIGRRSFGGFNRAMEDTWKASHRAHKEGGNTKHTTQQQQQQGLTDDQLLAKYANLVKQRNSGGDNKQRPIGNLGDKVRPRKQMHNNNNRSGEKRKRR